MFHGFNIFYQTWNEYFFFKSHSLAEFCYNALICSLNFMQRKEVCNKGWQPGWKIQRLAEEASP